MNKPLQYFKYKFFNFIYFLFKNNETLFIKGHVLNLSRVNYIIAHLSTYEIVGPNILIRFYNE